MMGGAVSVESELGKGSTFGFYVWLNLSSTVSYIEPIPQLKDVKVLVVDDHPIACKALVEQLSYLGLKTDSVQTAQEALVRLEEADRHSEPFHMALIDR